MKLKAVVSVCMVVLAIVGIFFFAPSDGPVEEKEKIQAPQKERRNLPTRPVAVKARKTNVVARVKTQRAERVRTKNGKRQLRVMAPDEIFAEFKGEDRKRVEALQAALDANEPKRILEEAKKAALSPNPAVREEAMEAFGSAGAGGMLELTKGMADSNEDVAQKAEDLWELKLSEVEDSGDRYKLAMAAMSTLGNSDILTSVSGQMTGAASEYIDGEEDAAVQSQRRREVVQGIADLIEDGSEVQVRIAKEAFEEITGSKWHNVAEAERYLENPDDYEAPEVP